MKTMVKYLLSTLVLYHKKIACVEERECQKYQPRCKKN